MFVNASHMTGPLPKTKPVLSHTRPSPMSSIDVLVPMCGALNLHDIISYGESVLATTHVSPRLYLGRGGYTERGSALFPFLQLSFSWRKGQRIVEV